LITCAKQIYLSLIWNETDGHSLHSPCCSNVSSNLLH